MKVLIACEFTQIVCKAFREKGHEAYSCDLLPTEGNPDWHIQGDVLELLDDGWDMMIAHPPCSFISNAAACRLYPKKGQLDKERYQKGLKAKKLFLRLLNANISKRAIENPVHSKVFEMPPHTQEIQPYLFGHPYTKKTRLWLINLPCLFATSIVEIKAPYCPAGTSRKNRKKYGTAKRGEDRKNRSRTFEGIARAMAEQWG